MKRQRAREVRVLVRRADGCVLLVRWSDEPDAPWQLPGGAAGAGCAAEQTARELCHTQTGLAPAEFVRQASFVYGGPAGERTYECFTAEVAADEALPLGCAVLRWIRPGARAEYRIAQPDLLLLERL